MMMYNDIDKKFDHITKKAIPYLVLAPPTFRNELVKLMDALFHQLLQRSKADFDEIYGQINEMLDQRTKFESLTETKLHNFAGRFETHGWQISKMNKRLDKSERKIESLEKSVNKLSVMIKKTTPMEKVQENAGEKVQENAGEKTPLEVPVKISNYVEPSLIKLREYLKNNKEFNNSIIREICGVTHSQAKYLLQKLVKEGVIKRSGPLNRPEYIIL